MKINDIVIYKHPDYKLKAKLLEIKDSIAHICRLDNEKTSYWVSLENLDLSEFEEFCRHEYVLYVGLTEQFKYCKYCDKKQDEKD